MVAMKSKAADKTAFVLVGCIMFVWSALLALGGLCFDYVLYTWFQKDIPWWGDAICGLLTSAMVVPAAVVTVIISLFGG